MIKRQYIRMKIIFFIVSLVFIFAMIVFSGCSKSESIIVVSPPTPLPPVIITDTLVIKYLALGDSYTIGEGVSAPERYPSQATVLLRQKGIFFGSVEYIAQTGWTTTNLAAAIASKNLTNTYDIVTLLIGVNDQYQKNDTTGYRAKFTNLLETSIRLAANKKSRVIVLSIPDYGITPFGAGWPKVGIQIDQFNEINKSVTNEYKVAYLDITVISRRAANNSGLILGYGPHFTGAEYGLWAVPLADLIAKALK